MPNCNPTATSTTLFTSTSAASSSAKEDSDSGIASFATETSDQSSNRAHTITAAPLGTSIPGYRPNSTLIPGNECLIQDASCSLQGPGHSLDGLRDECILWDTSCSGNRSVATTQFYGSIMGALQKNKCFFDASPDCTKNNPLGRMSAFDEVKAWMRSPQCELNDPSIIALEGGQDADVIKEDLFLNQTCCDNCEVAVDRVDVYYWPDPNANTSCLSIVGDGDIDLAVGATTDKSETYWACTSWSSIEGQSGSGSPVIIKTADLTTIASVTFRTYRYNPWIKIPCESSLVSLSSSLNPKHKPRGAQQYLHPRGHTLVAPNGSVSTAVSGNFTL